MGATLSAHDPGGVVPIGQGKNIINVKQWHKYMAYRQELTEGEDLMRRGLAGG